MVQQKEKITPEQAQALLAQERQQRAEACIAEVTAALQQHRCRVVAPISITADGRLVARVEIVAQE